MDYSKITKEEIDQLKGYEKTRAIEGYQEWLKNARKSDRITIRNFEQNEKYHANKEKGVKRKDRIKLKNYSVVCRQCNRLQSLANAKMCVHCKRKFDEDDRVIG